MISKSDTRSGQPVASPPPPYLCNPNESLHFWTLPPPAEGLHRSLWERLTLTLIDAVIYSVSWESSERRYCIFSNLVCIYSPKDRIIFPLHMCMKISSFLPDIHLNSFTLHRIILSSLLLVATLIDIWWNRYNAFYKNNIRYNPLLIIFLFQSNYTFDVYHTFSLFV